MKRTLTAAVLLLLLILSGTLAACSDTTAPASEDSMAGSYRLVRTAGKGSDDIDKLKDGVNLVVREDNTGTLSLMTDVHELSFDPEKKVCSSDDVDVPYAFNGRYLLMATKHFRMVFERQ